jgi:biotin transport system substrate-specific component
MTSPGTIRGVLVERHLLMSTTRLSDLRLPVTAGRSRALDLSSRVALVVCASLFVAICAHVSVPLSFTPVPFTLQPFAVILCGMVLGPRAGFAALALYLAEGAAGLPVWTPAGLPGVARLLGPTGGYLFAYPVAAAIAGSLKGILRNRLVSFLAGGTLAMAAIYACGTAWFSFAVHLPFTSALAATVAPFAAADVVKICIAAGIARMLQGTR